MQRTHRRSREAGSGPVTALLMLGVLALVVAALFTAEGATAGGESSSAQHAADAAALAGAKDVVEEIPGALATGFRDPDQIAGLLGGVCTQTGRVEANRLAQANGATLTSYCWDPARDEVSVRVQLRVTSVSGPPAEARAEAATTFEAGSCRLAADFVVPTAIPIPTPTPPPPPDPDDEPPLTPPPPPPPPAPLPPVSTTLDCGFGPLAVVYYPASARFTFVGLLDDLADLRPRLTR